MTNERISNDPSLQALYAAISTMEADFREGMSEYALISRLQKAPFELLDEKALRDNLLLFQCHFVLFNLLYTLQDKWAREGKGWLDILATNILLLPPENLSERIAQKDPLRAYYLDWKNLDATCRDEVDELISGFWKKMGVPATPVVSDSALAEAKSVLEIGDDAVIDRALVKRQYRRLQHVHHPDKGGDNQHSRKLVWAYELLMTSVEGCR